jgi:hypothetical protein
MALLGLVLPLTLASLGYRWTRTKPWHVKGITLLIAPLTYYTGATIYWEVQANSIRATGHYVCGAFGAAAVLSTLYGTIIHLVLGAIMFLIVSFVWKRQAMRTGGGSS